MHRVSFPKNSAVILLIGATLTCAQAAPKLRLVSATVGPVTVAAGSNGAAQTIEAYNAGDGALALAITSSASWLSGSTGAARACTRRSGSCLPVTFTLNTSGLSAGTYTALATIA